MALGTARTIDAAHGAAGQLAAARGELYRFLARQLAVRPGAQHSSTGALWDAWLQNAGALGGEHLLALDAYLRSPECTLDRLDREFSELFCIPTGRYLAPIESAYRGGGNGCDSWAPESLRGPSFHAVRNFYKRVKFEPRFDIALESDHLACELDFLAFLCESEAAAWDMRDVDAARACRAEELDFSVRHPLRWVGAVRARCVSTSSDPYYDVALTVIDEFLRLEVDQLTATEGRG